MACKARQKFPVSLWRGREFLSVLLQIWCKLSEGGLKNVVIAMGIRQLTADLKSREGNLVPVRPRSPAPLDNPVVAMAAGFLILTRLFVPAHINTQKTTSIVVSIVVRPKALPERQ